MRILVLQLARFGDIYQSWPTIHALKRQHPGAELHVLVRQRFRDAADFPGITVHALPTQEILRPLFEDRSESEANEQLIKFIKPLRDQNFNLIINLSFSPVSSYLTDYLAGEQAQIRGYTRHADGHLHIPDDTSAYFYAQVGIDRANRYHVTELFASIAGVDLYDGDFTWFGSQSAPARSGVVVQLGASTSDKAYPPELWVEVLRRLDAEITLIGSPSERALSETVANQCSEAGIINRTGQTALPELFQIIQNAQLLIGADSAPMHMAALANTRVLNLSSATVNFWETGPLSPGSRILYKSNINQIAPDAVAREAAALLKNEGPCQPCIIREKYLQPYSPHEMQFDSFAWDLIQALYTGSAYPETTAREDHLSFQRLFELCELALGQMANWENDRTRPTAAKILGQIDEMLADIASLNPRVNPVVQWFETQRLRIPPGTNEETLAKTKAVFQDLYWVTSVYRREADIKQTIARAVALCRACAPELREYNMSAVGETFQNLVSTLHELARHSTKVAEIPWSSVLGELGNSLENRDYIQLADFLQWKLVPGLEDLDKEKETLNQDVIF